MMKTLMAAAGLVSLFVVPAQAERVRYFGTFHIVSKTDNGQCDDYDPVGDRGVARFQPRISGNPDNTNTRLGWFYMDGARGFVTDGFITDTYKKVDSMNLFDGFGPMEPKPQVRFSSQKPDPIKDNTKFVQIVGNILNYDSMAGCEIKFEMVVQQRID